MSDAAAALAGLWQAAGCAPEALERLSLTGCDPILPGPFKVGTAALASIGASALAAAECWRWRTGRAQAVGVEIRAAATAFRSERYLRVDGQPPADPWSPISGYYRTGDGRWMQLHCNFPHHRDGVLRILGCEASREAVGAAVLRWQAASLENALAEAGMCAGMVRSAEEWALHPQARAVASLPLLEIVRIGDSPPEPCGTGNRPLSGVRVLDLTRVIAGPVCGRTLAAHGAEVMLVTAHHLPGIPLLVMDTGRGKLSVTLDLRRAEEGECLRRLIREADVFCQGYRPGALDGRGLSPEEVAALRPGIVYVTLSAYGQAGPWRGRRGFDSLVQSVSGIAHEGGLAAGVEGPRPLPAQALDHATGYLAAFGAMAALARRAREGGSYLVRLSLARTGRWIDGLGRVDGILVRDLRPEDVADLMESSETPFGIMQAVAPAEHLAETPARWTRPAAPLGTHDAAWPH
ncbi:MAG: CoA transferase [Candidatus Rokubacteria bacterium]|nr:CoA transferase [Candidatus Rokubacteria bacterium]